MEYGVARTKVKRIMRIQFVLSSLGMGGAERVASELLHHWAESGHEVCLVLLHSDGSKKYYPIHKNIEIVGFGPPEAYAGFSSRILRNLRIVLRLRRIIKVFRPDVIVSFLDMTNVISILASAGLGVPVVISERTDPRHHDIGLAWGHLRRLTYPFCSRIAVQHQGVADFFSSMVPVERINTIPNGVRVSAVDMSSETRRKIILYLGRLASEKCVDNLIRAFSSVGRNDWQLLIAGDGPELKRLESLVATHQVGELVSFMGQVEDVFSLLASVSIFVLPSRFEGMPNALCEAMVVGLPSIATATAGAKSLIRDEENGLIVPIGDEDALAEQMVRLMDDEFLRRTLGENAKKIREKIDAGVVFTQWDRMVDSVVGETKQHKSIREMLSMVLRGSGLCVDSSLMLDWILKHHWTRVVAFRFLRLRFSPCILREVLSLSCSLEERGRLFSQSISYLNVGGTFKTTGGQRTVLADEVVTQLTKNMNKPSLLEIGASDGSSSENLLRSKNLFGKMILSDRHNIFYMKRNWLGTRFLDGDGCFLGVKLGCFYLLLGTKRKMDRTGWEVLETVNPVIAARYGMAQIERFDMFTGKRAELVDIIRCSNILNVSYFSSQRLMAAVRNLSESLIDGGYLVISQNNQIYVDGEAYFVLQKKQGRLALVLQRNDHAAVGLFSEGVDLNTITGRESGDGS